MRLLLDTHALLWWLYDGPLSAAARVAIADQERTAFVSPASVWEAEIKAAAGRLELRTDLIEEVRINAFEVLPINLAAAQSAAWLPLHHRDPFDRMLIAQAQLEGLTIVTRDPVFGRYPVATLTA